MAFSKSPTDWVAGIEATATNLTIPLADLGLTQNDVTPTGDPASTTEDVRKVFLALCTMMADAWNTVGPDGRPTKMTIQTSERMDGEDDVQRNFSLAFSNTISAEDVAAEPS